VLAFSSSALKLSWLTNLNSAQVNLLGSASPVIRRGLVGDEPEVYSASFAGAVGLVTGRSCPFEGAFECGPSRTTNGATVSGSCNCATGLCVCPSGAGLACFQGPACGSSCSGNGVCTEGVGGATSAAANFSCACAPCYSGATCSVYTCGGSSSKAFINTPAGQAAVGVPVGIVLALGLALAWWRVVHPKAPWREALPSCLRGSASDQRQELLSVRDTYSKGGYGAVATEERPV
jgi:hypothetical protein